MTLFSVQSSGLTLVVPGSSFSDLKMMKDPGAWGCGRMKNVMLRCCRLVVQDGSEVVYIEGGMTKRGERTLSTPVLGTT